MENLSQELQLVPKGMIMESRRGDCTKFLIRLRHFSMLQTSSLITSNTVFKYNSGNKPQIPSHYEQHKTNFIPLVIKKIIPRLRP